MEAFTAPLYTDRRFRVFACIQACRRRKQLRSRLSKNVKGLIKNGPHFSYRPTRLQPVLEEETGMPSSSVYAPKGTGARGGRGRRVSDSILPPGEESGGTSLDHEGWSSSSGEFETERAALSQDADFDAGTTVRNGTFPKGSNEDDGEV